jgi:DNA repair exonuclease SbcCD ATPase subunit
MLRQQLEIEIQTKSSIDRELSQARARGEDATRRLTESQKSSTLVPTLRKRLEEIEQAQATRARSAEQAEEKNRALERDLTRARGEITRLATQLSARVDTQTLSLENDIKRLNDEQQERTLRIKMLTDRITELEAYAEENAALKAERDALQREVDRLRRAARDAVAPPSSAPPRVQVDPAGMATILRPNQSGTTRRVTDSENTLEGSLKQHLSGLLAREPGLIAVLSDDNGFPVAGVGTDQQQEGVSVLTSLAQELAFRVKEFVDLERIERIELADAAGRALRVRLFDWETQPLALACLGKRSLVANPDEELVVTAFPKSLQLADGSVAFIRCFSSFLSCLSVCAQNEEQHTVSVYDTTLP